MRNALAAAFCCEHLAMRQLSLVRTHIANPSEAKPRLVERCFRQKDLREVAPLD